MAHNLEELAIEMYYGGCIFGIGPVSAVDADVFKDPDGAERWYRNGKLYRGSGPTIRYAVKLNKDL